MDELFEVLTLIQTGKITKVPVVLVGSSFWSGMKEWITKIMLEQEHTISPDDLNLIPITDDIEEVVKIINDFYAANNEGNHKLAPNYEL